jgi:hypothetical protein
MAESSKRTRYLANMGESLIEQGYNITPISIGTKHPPHDGWSKIKCTKAVLKKWLENGLTYTSLKDKKEHTADVSNAGVGILTRDTPGVDIDVSDETMAKDLEQWVIDNIGVAPVRVGRAPRRLLLFRCTEPFKKVQSNVYLDEWDEPQKVEILADGQQFVAFHVHPDTHKPYEWLYQDGPLVTAADDLPTLNEAQAREIVKQFETRARLAGWTLKKAARTGPATRGGNVIEDPFADVKEKTRITDAELREKLMVVPNNDDYETWFQVGMALYHQYDGGDKGLELWHDWSESASNYDKAALDRHWPSFAIDEKGREPLTARYIIKLASEAETQQNREEIEAIITALREADTREKLESACKSAKKVDLDKMGHELVLNEVKIAYRRLTGHAIQIKTARDLIRYENPQYMKQKPEWLENWVYLTDADAFYNTETQDEVTITGFNSLFNRYMLTKAERMEGRARPEIQASDQALNVYELPIVRGKMYLPEADRVFKMNGVLWANSYTDRNIPIVKSNTPTPAERKAVMRVVAHFEHLIRDERERALVLSWLSYIVKERKKPNWAVLLQGVENDGKSLIATMMGLILGAENVKFISPRTMQGSDFTDWAHGALLGVIEELKIEGHSRFDALNAIKDKITNPVIAIHPKGGAEYNVVNTMAYLILTNFRDSMPMTAGNTRFFPVFCRIQTPQALGKFKAENPDYFIQLYRAITTHPVALRRWLLEYDYHEEFNPVDRALSSHAKMEMIMLAKSEEEEVLEDLLESRAREDHTEILFNATSLVEEIIGTTGVRSTEMERRVSRVLQARGFSRLGRIRIGTERHSFWSKEPERFRDKKGEILPNAIKEWIDGDL